MKKYLIADFVYNCQCTVALGADLIPVKFNVFLNSFAPVYCVHQRTAPVVPPLVYKSRSSLNDALRCLFELANRKRYIFFFTDNEKHVTDYVAFIALAPSSSETSL